MKVEQFAISTQWGSGHHYFVRTDVKDETQIRTLREQELTRVSGIRKRNNRGATPSVYVWKRIG